MKIGLVIFETTPQNIVDEISDSIGMTFKADVEIINESKVPVCKIRESEEYQLQLNADNLIDYVSKVREEKELDAILGILEYDLFYANYKYVIGLSDFKKKAAIVSIIRLKDETPGKFRDRSVKEAIHELGHALGIKHCTDKKCVMSFSYDVAEVDEKDFDFCQGCKGLLDL